MSGNPRAILDTHVLVNAMVAHLSPNSAIADQQASLAVLAFTMACFELCFSQETMREFREVGVDRLGLTNNLGATQEQERAKFITRLEAAARFHQPGACPVRCADPKDQMFLDLAAGLEGGVFLISQDREVLRVRHQMPAQIVILPPKEFLETRLGLCSESDYRTFLNSSRGRAHPVQAESPRRQFNGAGHNLHKPVQKKKPDPSKSRQKGHSGPRAR